MRIETIGRYNYLTEWWYDKTKHRNLPNRARVSEKLVKWIEEYNVPLSELSPHMNRDDYPMTRAIKLELEHLSENRNFYGEKSGGRNSRWERWWIVGQEIQDDKILEMLKGELASTNERWRGHGERHLQEIMKYARNQPRTPAWKKFLETQV